MIPSSPMIISEELFGNDRSSLFVDVRWFIDAEVTDVCCDIIGKGIVPVSLIVTVVDVPLVEVLVAVGSRTLRATTKRICCEHCRSMPATCSELMPRTQT